MDNPKNDLGPTFAGFDIEASYADRPDNYLELWNGESEDSLLTPKDAQPPATTPPKKD